MYSVRPSIGIISTKGIIPSAHSFDTIGTLAKDPEDLANMLTSLVDQEKTTIPVGGYTSVMDKNWTGLKIGTIDPELWQYPAGLVKPVAEATEQMVIEITRCPWLSCLQGI